MKKITPIFALIVILLVGFLAYLVIDREIYEGELKDHLYSQFQHNPTGLSKESILKEDNKNKVMNITKALFNTNKGSFEIELFSELAPKTVENFIKLAENGFYNNIKFHRVISGFMVQSGDPLSKDDDIKDQWGTGGPGYQFEDEIHSENNNIYGTLSMANSGLNTNGSQFFINIADNNFLDTKHTVFGKVVSGIDVVLAIGEVETSLNDRPVESIIINSIIIEK